MINIRRKGYRGEREALRFLEAQGMKVLRLQ